MDRDNSARIIDHVRSALEQRAPLRIVGGSSKAFYAPTTQSHGTELSLAEHRGIVAYEPRELVVTARAGTLLAELEQTLAQQGQMLPFEPPHFGASATVGGTIACNFSGPRRAYAGAARDFLLGVEIINGRGEQLRFGGQVMKNVAGYDVSRLMAGALGTLGVILSATFKVLPRATQSLTLRQECSATDAIVAMNRWAGQPLPISATAHDGDHLHIRLEGSTSGVYAARQKIGGDVVDDAHYWSDVREQRHGFFSDPRPLWRLSVPSTTAPLPFPGKTLSEWGGALRWIYTDMPPSAVRELAQRHGGHATLFRAPVALADAFTPLPNALLQLHRRLKTAFDPHGILNPGRMYTEF